MTDPMTPERLAEIEQRFASGRIVNVATQRDLLAEVRRLQAAAERARVIIRDACDQIAERYGDDWDHLPGCQAHEPGDLAGLCPLCCITAALDGDA